jgi:thiol-disulfide isomerase/thioredoxin
MKKNTLKNFRKKGDNKKNRKTRRRHTPNKNKKIVVGKIYANWCGHCQNMTNDWENLKNYLAKQGNLFEIVEIEQQQESTLVPHVNKKYLKKSPVKVSLQRGYPTLFKIKGGNVSYFQGNRTFEEMSHWYLQ